MLLLRKFPNQIDVEPPSFKTNNQWELTARGWVGYIPLRPDLGIAMRPRVSLSNLFRMFEYAYQLRSFVFLPQLMQSSSLADFFQQLAKVLAKRVVDRTRRGLHKVYISETSPSSSIRGRLRVHEVVCKPWSVLQTCEFEEHTRDNQDNQILAWTLRRIIESGLCSGEALTAVRQGYYSLAPQVSLEPIPAEVCLGRTYNRLNEDYQALHALCHFFLSNTGPTHHDGQHDMVPFMVEMPKLFELFVAEWLKAHLPSNLRVRPQYNLPIAHNGSISFQLDLLIENMITGQRVMVLDTKYKVSEEPDSQDLQQAIAYGHSSGCRHVALLYPKALLTPLDEDVRGIRLRTASFDLKENLDVAGKNLLSALGIGP
jgi:5-methylcytosine-specific restriction enzyme subunit McrC